LLAGASFLTGAGGAKPLRKQPPSRFAYTLSLRFEGTFRTGPEGKVSGESYEEERDFTFRGRTGRFWLVRSGTTAKPSYTLASSDGTPLYLQIPGYLGFTGLGHFEFVPPCPCEHTMTLTGDKSADVVVLLVKNRLHLEISSDAMVIIHPSGSVRCCFLTDTTDELRLWAPHASVLPAKLGVIGAKEVRFGQPFTLVRIADLFSYPALHQPFSGGSQDWSYHWTLRFTPAKAR
jgi:hypothetical protein